MEQSRFDLLGHQHEFKFLKLIPRESTKLIKKPWNKGLITHMLIDLHDTIVTHEKSIYNIFDLFGDVGGLLDLFLIFFTFFFQPYN